MKTENEVQAELIDYTIEGLKNLKCSNVYAADVHNEIFNTDYFIIGRYAAEQWLVNSVGVFPAIDTVKEYEESNFGEVTTDLSEAEKVCNMYVYIKGEELLSELDTLRQKWDDRLTDEDIDAIISELEEL